MRSAVCVLGSGSWGTALAILLARNGVETRLWGHNALDMQTLISDRVNQRFLPQQPFPDLLTPHHDLAMALSGNPDVLIAVPSHVFRSLLKQIKPLISPTTRIVWATKGLDEQHDEFLHVVVEQELGSQHAVAVLSGPSFAHEVAAGLPTAVALAANTETFADDLIAYFHNTVFRVYRNSDLIGLQWGGAVKNVVAIATGISDGMGFGANSRAALVTRGLAEMIRLGVRLGAQNDTLYGLAGLGDLVLTCTNDASRNRRFGLALGQGHSVADAEAMVGQVVEGAHNAAQICRLAKAHQVDMPISEQILSLIEGRTSLRQAVDNLLNRQFTTEI